MVPDGALGSICVGISKVPVKLGLVPEKVTVPVLVSLGLYPFGAKKLVPDSVAVYLISNGANG